MYSRRYELNDDQRPTPEQLDAAGPVGSWERSACDKTFWPVTTKVAEAFRAKHCDGTGLKLTVFDASYCFFVDGDEDKVAALPQSAEGCHSVSTVRDSGQHCNRD